MITNLFAYLKSLFNKNTPTVEPVVPAIPAVEAVKEDASVPANTIVMAPPPGVLPTVAPTAPVKKAKKPRAKKSKK